MSGAEVRAPRADAGLAAPIEAVAEVATESFSGSQSHNRAIASGVMWQGGLRWLAQILSWTATIVVARRLSPSDYGIAGTTVFFALFLALIVDGGLARALVVTRATDSKTVAQVHTASSILSWVLAALLCAVAFPIAHIYRELRIAPVLMFLSTAIVLNGGTAIRVAALQQRLEYRLVAQVEFVKSLTQAIMVLACAVAGLGYWALAIGLVSGYLLAYIYARQLIAIPLMRPNLRELRPQFRYSGQLLASAMSWYLYSGGDFVVLGRVSGLAALGYYQFAWNIAQLPGEKLANILQAVVHPFFGAIGDDRRALRHYFLVLSELLVAVVLPILAGFALLCPIAVPIIFGERWSASVPIMQILVACAAMSSVSLLSQHVLGATGKAMVSARMHLVALLVLPPCFYIGAKLNGPLGVATVWLIFQPLLVGYPLLRLKEVIDLTVGQYLANLVAPAVSVLAMVAAVLLTQRMTDGMAAVPQMAVLATIGAIVYCAMYLGLFRPRVERILDVWRNR
jgi:O-antigen/teichoic acid export membrane protein